MHSSVCLIIDYLNKLSIELETKFYFLEISIIDFYCFNRSFMVNKYSSYFKATVFETSERRRK